MAKGISKILITVFVIVLLCINAISGLTIGSFQTYPVFDEEHGIRKGFDLAGGSVIVYQASEKKDNGDFTAIEPSGSQMEIAKKILTARLDRKGFTEASVTVKGNMLEVELPSVQDTSVAINEIGKTAKLSFYGYDPATKEPLGDVILTGEDVKKAAAGFQQVSQMGPAQHVVNIEITDAAAQRFYEATVQYRGKAIAIVLDNEIISTPGVDEVINSNQICIVGNFDQASAKEMAALIQDGQLPFHLSVVQQRTAGPTLGEDALQTSLTAALIGLILVFLFMILYYRLPGFVASVALVLYVELCCTIYAMIHVNLSLPGIAGVILSIGMAVDANVIIFERIKDELKLGKTLKASVSAGFKRAMASILDSNITTLIAAGVLYFIGSGPIKGFAITLGIGILVSMFTAIFVTKFLLKAMLDLKIKNKFLYGASGRGGSKNV
ncbi:MAG: protein translocase subunit SecD [Clostridia bacterium]|nr:protein translocase subunit SecD [Clostridia bacterium]